MSVDKQKSLDAMRTYARDVARETGKTPETKKPEVEDNSAAKSAPKEKVVKHENIVVSAPQPHKEKAERKPEPPKPEPHRERKPEPKQEEKKTPKEIPPFHELQKSVKTNIKAETEADTKEKNKPTGINPTKAVGGGTVITDNKKSRPSFFASLHKSLSDWISTVKKKLQPKKKNAYAVTKTERRRGVVQKATSKTGTIFTADSETLREQIKARQRAEKHEHDDLSWSPFTEPGYPLLEGDEQESTDPRVTKVTVAPKTHSVPKPVIKSTEKIPELQEPEEDDELFGVPVEAETKELEPSPEAVSTQSSETETEILDTPEPVEPVEEVTEAVVVDEDEGEDEEKVAKETFSLPSFSLHDTNTLAMLLVGVTIGVGVLAFVLFGIFKVGSTPENIVQMQQQDTTLFVTGALAKIVLPNQTFNDLVGAVNTATINKPSGTTAEFEFVSKTGQDVPITTLMTLLRTETSDDFSDVVKTVRYIHTESGERALLITVPGSTTALGGMLNWEDSLLADVGAVLDIQNVPPSAGSYVDSNVGKVAVRTLRFDDRDILTYGVFNDSVIIIATDTSVLQTYLNK